MVQNFLNNKLYVLHCMHMVSITQDPRDVGEIQSGVRSGLMSWLSFGTSMAPVKQSREDGGHHALRVLHRETIGEPYRFDADMGPPTKHIGNKSNRRSKCIEKTMESVVKRDDRNARELDDHIRRVRY